MVSPYFFPEGGGLENYVLQISKRLIQRGYRLTVVSLSKKKHGKTDIQGIPVHLIRSSVPLSNTPLNITLLPRLLFLLHGATTDLIHAHTPVPFAADMAAMASRLSKVPLVITYHSQTLLRGQFFLDLLASCYRPFELLTLNQTKKIVTVTKRPPKHLKRWQKKIKWIPPGVDPHQFIDTPYPSSCHRLLYIGPLDRSFPSKGIEIILQSVMIVKNKIPDVMLDIVGGGDLEVFYRERVKKDGCSDNVVFHGKCPYHAIPSFLQRTNLLIVPSLKSEGTPTVILEAMSSGRPVIGTDVGGIPDIIESSNSGIVIPPSDPQALAKAVENLLEDPDRAERYGKLGREAVRERYSWDHITDQYEEIYREI